MKDSTYVYAAGPMEGLTLEQMTGWRTELKRQVAERNALPGLTEQFSILDPCDREDFHSGIEHVDTFTLAKRIVKLDELDVYRSRVVFMNLSQMDELNLRCWGSICELAYAAHLGVPTILILPKPTLHPFALVYATEIYTDFDTGVKALFSYFR